LNRKDLYVNTDEKKNGKEVPKIKFERHNPISPIFAGCKFRA
jgi:hypothetical protein